MGASYEGVQTDGDCSANPLGTTAIAGCVACALASGTCECCIMVVLQPSKLTVRVRFPSFALYNLIRGTRLAGGQKVSYKHLRVAFNSQVFYAFVAQRIEQESSKFLVAGSTPAEGTHGLPFMSCLWHGSWSKTRGTIKSPN